MHDWPTTSMRTKVFSAVTVALLLVQGAVVAFDLFGARSRGVANEVGVLVVLAAIGMMVWSASVNQDGAVRVMATLLAAGLLLRVMGLLEFTYLAPMPPPAIPNMPTRWVLGVGYLALLGGMVGSVRALSARVSTTAPTIVAVSASSLVGLSLAFAAFGPLPAVATELTSRDHFAIGLLTADTILLGLAIFITVALLQLPGGTLSRAWVWITMGLVLATMGDTVLPMLEPADAANYTSLLWGLAYVLAAVGASIVVDVEQWHTARGEHVLALPLSARTPAAD